MDAATFRRVTYGILATLSLGAMLGRILGVEAMFEPSLYHAYPQRTWPAVLPKAMPTFSSNDRSRWATVKALVEQGTFVIGRRVEDPQAKNGYRDEGILFEEGYRSIDVVLHPERQEFYSTKPPLLTLMVAGEYGILRSLFGWELDRERWEVVCAVLITFNVLPLMVMLLLLARLLEEYGTTDLGRVLTFAAACFGTFLTTFAVSLNNHVPAACCVCFAAYPLLAGRATNPGRDSALSLITSGLFAGLAVCLDLPAAALLGAVCLWLVLTRGRLLPGLVVGVCALIPIGVQLGANHLAVGEWKPVYANFGGPWYEYPGSHWSKARLVPRPAGIDFADEPKHVYAFHLLLGHHGLLSLTPIWALSLVGLGSRLRTRRHDLDRLLAWCVPVTLVVVVFYVFRSNNYGGFSSGPRWLFWLTPVFLLALLPAADRLGRSRAGRALFLALLAVSVFSACYPVSNPWRHPWIYQLCEHYGWIRY